MRPTIVLVAALFLILPALELVARPRVVTGETSVPPIIERPEWHVGDWWEWERYIYWEKTWAHTREWGDSANQEIHNTDHIWGTETMRLEVIEQGPRTVNTGEIGEETWNVWVLRLTGHVHHLEGTYDPAGMEDGSEFGSYFTWRLTEEAVLMGEYWYRASDLAMVSQRWSANGRCEAKSDSGPLSYAWIPGTVTMESVANWTLPRADIPFPLSATSLWQVNASVQGHVAIDLDMDVPYSSGVHQDEDSWLEWTASVAGWGVTPANEVHDMDGQTVPSMVGELADCVKVRAEATARSTNGETDFPSDGEDEQIHPPHLQANGGWTEWYYSPTARNIVKIVMHHDDNGGFGTTIEEVMELKGYGVANSPPSVGLPTASEMTDAGGPMTIQVVVTDPDGPTDVAAVTADLSSVGLGTLDLLRWGSTLWGVNVTLPPVQGGTYRFDVTATDLHGEQGGSTGTLRVLSLNSPPSVDAAILPNPVPNDGTKATLTVTVSDPDGRQDIVGVLADLTALGGDVETLSGSGGTYATAFSLGPEIPPGDYPVVVSASDSAGHVAFGNVTCTVVQANRAPRVLVVDLSPSSITTEGGALAVTATVSDDDGPSDVATVVASASGRSASLSKKTASDWLYAGTLDLPNGLPIGKLEVTVEVTDLLGERGTGTGSVSVTAASEGLKVDAPVISPSTVYNDGKYVLTLAMRVSHSGGADAIDSAWADLSPLGGPAVLPMNDEGVEGDTIPSDGTFSARWTVPASTPAGSYVVTLWARDDAGGAKYAMAELEVRDIASCSSGPVNHPPVVMGESPEGNLEVGAEIVFRVAAVDVDGDDLAYLWTVGGREVGAEGAELAYTPTRNGTLEVRVEVSDGRSGLAYWEWSVEIKSAPPADEGDGSGGSAEPSGGEARGSPGMTWAALAAALAIAAVALGRRRMA